MHISLEGKSGITLALIGLAGAGAMMIAPDHTEIGWSFIIIAILGGAILTYYHICERSGLTWTPGHRRKMTSLAGMIICGVGFLCFAGVYFWPMQEISPKHTGATSKATLDPPTLFSLFMNDLQPTNGIRWDARF
jgi:hypothetical protein